MADNNQLNTAWLGELTNAHHDGTTQQIDDFVQAFETDNAKVLQKVAAVHQCRQTEDEVWLKSQRDPAAKELEKADKRQDAYISAFRYINLGHAGLPEGEFVKGEMKAARRATDLAIADLYKTLMAMQELIPSAALTALITQLKGVELYARQYYIASASGAKPSADDGSATDGGTSTGENTGGSDSDSGSEVTPVTPE